jgi:hypothetical protein
MRKLILVFIAVLFAVPALAVAGSPPSAADTAAAVKQCSGARTAMGLAPFKQLYGTNTNKSNAFGKCVSARAHQNALNRGNAAKQCASERTSDPTGFAAKYGKGAQHTHAFGSCVSSKTKAAAAAQVQATVNASKQCWTERQAGLAAFNTRYGTGASKTNAFGKCVSGKVKQSSP